MKTENSHVESFVNICVSTLLTYPGIMMFIQLYGSVLKIRAIVIEFYLLSDSDSALSHSQLTQSSLNSAHGRASQK